MAENSNKKRDDKTGRFVKTQPSRNELEKEIQFVRESNRRIVEENKAFKETIKRLREENYEINQHYNSQIDSAESSVAVLRCISIGLGVALITAILFLVL